MVVPRLAQLCVDQLLRTVQRMRGASDMLELNSEQLIERKLELQLELGEVCESLEAVHAARKALLASMQQLVTDLREELDDPLRSMVIGQVEALFSPSMSTSAPASIAGDDAEPHQGPTRVPCPTNPSRLSLRGAR